MTRVTTALLFILPALGLAIALALLPGTAQAATSPMPARNAATCKAFGAYQRHATRYRFAVLYGDAQRALHYLRLDTDAYLHLIAYGAPRAQVRQAAADVRSDCTDYAAEAGS